MAAWDISIETFRTERADSAPLPDKGFC